MSSVRLSAIVAAVLLWQTPLHAANIKIDGDDPRRSITVTIENATVDLVLEDLRTKYGFEVGGLKNANKGEPISATMSGDLRSVLERLLRNWNYMIVRSPNKTGVIDKVVIIDAIYGAQPSKAGQRAGGEAPADKMMQALSGQE